MQAVNHTFCFGTENIGHCQNTDAFCSFRCQNGCLALCAQSFDCLFDFFAQNDTVFIEVGFITAEQLSIFNFSIDAFTCGHLEYIGCQDRNIPSFRTSNDCFAQRMFTFCFCRCDQRQQRIFVNIFIKGNHIADFQSAVGQSAGFIKSNRVYLAHLFQSFAGLDDNTMLGCLPDSCHDCSRGSQNKSAGTEHNQNGYGTNDILCDDAGDYGNQQRNRNKPACSNVCYSRHRRFFVLCFLHHADQLLERTVLAHLSCMNINGTKAVDCAAEHILASGFIYRKGFAGHNRLVNRGFAAEDDTINRDCLTGENTQNITLDNLLSRNHFFLAI